VRWHGAPVPGTADASARAMSPLPLTGLAACAALALTGCVSQTRYEQALNSAELARTQLVQTQRLLATRDSAAELGRASMQKDLDEAAAAESQLKAELVRLGEDAGALSKVLGEMRHAHAAAEARAALYREVALKFKRMTDAGDLAITLREGRMVLRLPNDILFDSGRSELKPAGKRALSQVATILATIPDRRFQIAGHTDGEPIRLSPHKSNWDLSSARALAVTAFLTGNGVDPHALSAAGYGEFDPVESNATRAGMARNRRTEITLQPNIDELVAVP